MIQALWFSYFNCFLAEAVAITLGFNIWGMFHYDCIA